MSIEIKRSSFYQSWWHYPYNKAVKRIEHCLNILLKERKGTYQLGVVLKETGCLIGDYFFEVLEPSSITIGYTLIVIIGIMVMQQSR